VGGRDREEDGKIGRWRGRGRGGRGGEGACPPTSKNFLNMYIFNIYANVLNITQSLTIICVLGQLGP
jgi:hypothetical protein